MQIKTFRATSIHEALQLVREHLGPDAEVIRTREVRQGWLARRQIEVDAVFSEPNSSRMEPLSLSSPSDIASLQLPKSIETATELSSRQPRLHTNEPNEQQELWLDDQLHERPESLLEDGRLGSRQLETKYGAAAQQVFQELLDVAVEPTAAQRLIARACKQCDVNFLHDVWLIRGQVLELVAERLKVASSYQWQTNQQRIVAFVGPTGTGKTSTLAKLAWRAHHEHGLEVGIVTVDTWRHGAIDQVLQYAEQLSATLEVVSHPENLAPALQRLRECDLVLLDTAGRSPHDAVHLRGLHELLQIAQPDEVHLVLGASTAAASAASIIEKFAPLLPTQLDITKLDEASGLGHWLSLLWNGSLPVHLLTHGQQISSDMTVANSRRLATAILGQMKFAESDTTSPTA